MKRLLLPLLAALALPTAVNAESYWLVLTLGDGGHEGASALEKIEMISMEACENEGEKWMNIRKTKDGKNSRFVNDLSGNRAFICIAGK